MSLADEDDAIVRRRIYTQAAPIGHGQTPPFKRLVKKYLEFCQKVESPDGETEKVHTELLAALYAIQLQVRRQHAICDALTREQAMYADKQQQLLESIRQAQQDIEARKVELEQARVELKQKQEYEEVRQRVVHVPARSTTRAEMAAASRETDDLARQGGTVEATLARRQRQLAAVLHCVDDMYRGIQLERDADEEESAAAGAAQPHHEAMQVG